MRVHSGTSSYTIGRTGGVGFPGQEKLRADGVNSLALLPLSGPVLSVPGFIVVASQEIITLDTEHLALLELLAAEVTACLRVAVGVRDLRDKADRDPLTGLGHYGSFQELLPNARRSAEDRRLAVLYVDVDHFKQVNDSAGHAEGDRLLMAIAAAMQRALRGRDLVFRMGGDEFAALAEVVSEEEALAVGGRLREAVLESTGTSLSIGIAVASPQDSDETLLKRADEALYLVKQAGRGAVRLLPAPDEPAA
jgi:diguanylate cyclase (GGDEF)-like protein